jgi:hypothetical protein
MMNREHGVSFGLLLAVGSQLSIVIASVAKQSMAVTQAVMPRACGASSTPRLFGSIIGVSGILGRPVKPGDDN